MKDKPDKWEATPGNLLLIMVKAIQELKSEKDTEIAELKSENDELKEKIVKFEQMQTMLDGEIEKLKSNAMKTKEIKLTNK